MIWTGAGRHEYVCHLVSGLSSEEGLANTMEGFIQGLIMDCFRWKLIPVLFPQVLRHLTHTVRYTRCVVDVGTGRIKEHLHPLFSLLVIFQWST